MKRLLARGPGVPLSFAMHVVVAGTLWVAQGMNIERPPLIDPDDVIEVSLLSLPKQTTQMVQKATRTPDPVQGVVDPPPTPEPPPPQSDSDLVQHTPDAPAPQGNPDADKEKRDLLEQLRRDQARKDALAALGSQDRDRTDPDGTEGATGSASGALGDPKVALYLERVKQTLLPQFSPLQTDGELVVVIRVKVDTQGRRLDYGIETGSGDPSFDRAALRAVMRTEQLPAPSPDIMNGATSTFFLRFRPEDKL